MSRLSPATLLLVVLCVAPARAQQPAAAAAAPADRPAPPAGWDVVDLSRRPPPLVDEETAKKLFNGVRSGKRQKWDPLAMAVLTEKRELTFKWEEHEGGKVTMKTNNFGFRRDTDTDPRKTMLRVVVAGDSHTDGLVDNDESFVTLLEQHLDAQDPARRHECLNAGVGGNGPHNYLGMLRKALFLQPDVFVAMLYVGNDFSDAVYLHDHFSGRRSRQLTYDEYQKPLDDAVKKFKEVSLIGNSFNQAYRLKFLPDEEAFALWEVVHVFDGMARICAENGVRFVIGVIPAKPDVDEDDRDTESAIMADLKLTQQDMDVNERLRRGFVEAMRAYGHLVVDPADGMKASADAYYWLRDHHLNVAGNVVFGVALFEAVAPLLKDVPMPAAVQALPGGAKGKGGGSPK